MAKTSAGLLLYRRARGGLEGFLVHPGGRFWAHRDQGAWSIPKGEIATGEGPLAAAGGDAQSASSPHRAARVLIECERRVDLRVGPDHHAADHVGMASQVLRAGVQDEISSQRQRVLQIR